MASLFRRTSFTTVRFHRVPQKRLPACCSFFLASNKSSINIHLKVINEEKLRWGDEVTGNQGMLTGSGRVFNQIRLEILAEGSVLFTPPPGLRKQAWCEFFFFFFNFLSPKLSGRRHGEVSCDPPEEGGVGREVGAESLPSGDRGMTANLPKTAARSVVHVMQSLWMRGLHIFFRSPCFFSFLFSFFETWRKY